MTTEDFVNEIYINLIDQGWTLNDIDECDFFYYMDLLIFKAHKEADKRLTFIDQI